MTVAEMLKRISSAELAEWMAYYKVKAEEEEERRNADKKVWKPPDN